MPDEDAYRFDLAAAIESVAKPWWQSRGIIGAVVAMVASLAAIAGWAVDVEKTVDLIFSLTGLIGGALAWWGRMKATRPVSRTRVLPGLPQPERFR